MPEREKEHVYAGHQLTEDMLESTQTVFLIERLHMTCFAYLIRRYGAWSVWKRDDKFSPYRVIETDRSYEACLMYLGARSPGVLLSFEVWYSDTAMPER